MLLSQKGTSELNLFVISCDSLNLAMETEQEHTDSKLGGGQCNARRVMCILKYRILMRLQEDVVAFFLGSSVIPEFPIEDDIEALHYICLDRCSSSRVCVCTCIQCTPAVNYTR